MAGSAQVQSYCYDGVKSFTLTKWKIRKGSQLYCNSVILSYKQDDKSTADGKDPLLKYKSNVGGTVSELIASEGDVIHTGAELLRVQPCTHPVIMKDLCAECGTDLRHLDRDNFEKLSSATTFSMVHVVPELKVSLEQAEKLGRDDEDRLLKNKKLVLLVDLDQTLIHTTNDNVPKNLPDVHHFQLYGSYSPWYHTKLRPGTDIFLENISKYYELHICTFGARLYAHKIAKILDKDGKFFSHRILSRDECFDATSKTGNLKALFPRGDDMVCIIDDREDVWNFAPNVIHVKPYSYFRNTGDINSPLALNNVPLKPICDTVNSSVQSNTETSKLSGNDKVSDGNKQNGEETHNERSSMQKDQLPPENQDKSPLNKNSDIEEKGEKINDKTKQPPLQGIINPYFDGLHSDDYLLYLEEILITVHKTFYEEYYKLKSDGQKGIPDLKKVVPYVRSETLKNVSIVFSSVIPTNCVPESHYLWTLAESMGARVTRELEFDIKDKRTTHVVATKPGTAKVNSAKRHKKIHVVSLEWLLCCAERWERADERLFPLAKDGEFDNDNSSHSFSEATKDKLRGKRVRSCKRKHSDKEQSKQDEKNFSERIFVEAGLSLSQDDIADMDREIDEACSENSEDENVNASSSSNSSSSAESLSSGDYPKGWKKRQKCEADDDDFEKEAGESSDADTIGSVDEEIADAVKQEFSNY